jgi:hypothetical protein
MMLCGSITAFANSHMLSGKMAWWQQAVGPLVCEVTVEPTEGKSRRKGFVIVEASVAPGNVFHWHTTAPGLEGDQYDGYSASKNLWWETQADSTGYASVFRSSDGFQYEQFSAPSSLEGGRTFYRETYSIGRDGIFHEEVTRRLKHSWRPYNEVSCKKVRSPSPIQRTEY